MPSDAGNALARSRRSQGKEAWDAGGARTDLPLEVARLGARVAELERDYARLERFAAVAAHEMAEPLVTTEAYATQLLERLGERADPESRSNLEAISRSATKMRLVIEALLHASRSEDALASEVVDLARVVDDCLDLLGYEVRSRRARIVVGRLPTVTGEPSLLGTVLKNLLSNALRYGPRTGGTIRISASREPSAWRISVVSEGTPIPQADRQRIFAPFERGRDERRTPGVGLGLTISRQIVERHGGTLGVEPCPRGNRFYFTIPD